MKVIITVRCFGPDGKPTTVTTCYSAPSALAAVLKAGRNEAIHVEVSR